MRIGQLDKMASRFSSHAGEIHFRLTSDRRKVAYAHPSANAHAGDGQPPLKMLAV